MEAIKSLSEKQKKIRNDVESTKDKKKRTLLKKERSKTLKDLKKLLKEEEENQLDEELKQIEQHKDDSNKYNQSIRQVNSHKPKKPLAIYDEHFHLITSESEQLETITKYFKELFSSEDRPEPVQPAQMNPPYTTEEIKKAAKKVKNNKATGCDNVYAELIKYGTDTLYEQISALLNKTRETGEYPKEIRRGILTPLAKPPKKDERANVRTIILLSVLRKVITTTLIERCWQRMKNLIPPSKAAYQSGRSTTEQVFTLKILVEKAITSENYEVFILMLDMPKALDTVNRSKLMEILKDIPTPREFHLMFLLIDDVIINVRPGNNMGSDILTAIGICQGDCLSALLFIIYLAFALKPTFNHRENRPSRNLMVSSRLAYR